MLFFTSNTSISKARLKLAKNQANTKQQPDAEVLLFQNYSHLYTLSFKNNRTYKISKGTNVSVFMRLHD